ncbi:MAG TPA: hypothetical protein VGD37_00220 [Kofleriaceae bacterium]
MLRVRLVVLACLASCGARMPAPVDVDALLRARGPIEARRDLVIRVTGDPRDVAAHLALAELAERLHRPSEALEALEAVVALGGPLGVRWHAADQARLARLIAARGRARLARGAASALGDLERARGLGAALGDDELRGARVAAAIVALRHSDAEVRDEGRRVLAGLRASPGSTAPGRSNGAGASPGRDAGAGTGSDGAGASPGTNAGAGTGRDAGAGTGRDAGTGTGRDAGAGTGSDGAGASQGTGGGGVSGDWAGARPAATPEQRGRFGAWLWQQGARRAAWDELAAWHATTVPPRDPGLEDTYLAAARWWIPLDQPAPPALAPGDASAAAMRCAFAPCAPREVAGDDARERAYLLAPLAPPVRDPADAAAVVVITLHQALRGEGSWGAAIAARIDLAAFSEPARLAALPGFARPVIAWLAGHEASPRPSPGDGATADQRLVIAATRVLAGGGADEIAGPLEPGPYGDALRAIVAPRPPFAGDARAEAAARHASLAVAGAASPASTGTASPAVAGTRTASIEQLREIAAAFAREPAIADRLARDAIAGAVDAAAMHATIASLFDAIGDPARARVAWQAAVDASPEPAFVRGLAEAQARQGDGDAALITATAAAAASGDPAIVWTAVAQALAGSGRYVHALDAARSAIELAGPEALPAALDVAIAASRALGRDGQAARLAAQRARVAPAGGGLGDRDPTDGAAALEAHRRGASADTVARLWVASRWNPRDVELRAALLAAVPAGDPRRAVIAGELVDLAAGPDRALGRAAAAALPYAGAR